MIAEPAPQQPIQDQWKQAQEEFEKNAKTVLHLADESLANRGAILANSDDARFVETISDSTIERLMASLAVAVRLLNEVTTGERSDTMGDGSLLDEAHAMANEPDEGVAVRESQHGVAREMREVARGIRRQFEVGCMPRNHASCVRTIEAKARMIERGILPRQTRSQRHATQKKEAT